MSIEIDWASLTTGPSGLALADSIRDFIHDKFQQVTLPRFIRSVHVHTFDFGEECPVVELKDISDPLPEFYDDDEESSSSFSSSGNHQSEEQEAVTGAIEPTSAAQTQPTHTLHQSTAAPPPSTRLPPLNLRSLPFPPPDQITTPFLSRSSTPGLPIPGGTSNFSYFHLPLSAGLPGPAQTPLPRALDNQPPSAPPQAPQLSTPRGPRAPTTAQREPNTTTLHHDRTSSQRQNQTQHQRQTQPPPTHAPNHPPTHNPDPRAQDLQTTLRITYSGSLSLSLTAEILLDYPMRSFVGIPLALRITGLSFDGVALLAYLRHQGGGGGADTDAEMEEQKSTVHFCFLGREDAGAAIGAGAGGEDAGIAIGEQGDEISSGHKHGHGHGPDVSGAGDGEDIGGLLREIRVTSEIGRQEGGKQVLKNVGKVEKFVLEQVRRIVEEEFVWPSFWTFLV